MFNKIKEFFRVLGELRYLIPVMRYKFPDPEDQASLAHTFQATTDKFSERPFLHFENECCADANSAATKGVTNGNRTTVDVDPVGRNLTLPDDGKRLAGEGFIQFK